MLKPKAQKNLFNKPDVRGVSKIKPGDFVIVGLPYSVAKKQYVCNYVAKVEATTAYSVKVFYLRKYLNQNTEFVFITPDDVMPESSEIVVKSQISHVLDTPSPENLSRSIFI